MAGAGGAIDWLLGLDPSLRWQAMRDLLDAPEAAWRAERAKVETEGWGARLLSHQDVDGQWAGGSFVPRDFNWSEWKVVGQPWTATSYALTQLRQFGLDPASESALRTVELAGRNARWEEGGQPFWPGRVWFHMDDGPGSPSPWITLKALRVLRWWDQHPDSRNRA